MKFIEFAVKRPIFGHLVTLFLLVGGIIAIFSLNRDVFPDFSVNIATINVVYPNASPEEIEDLVTTPIEEEIQEISKIEEYTSFSMEGLSMIMVEIDQDVENMDSIIFDLQRRVDRIDLPENAEDPEIEAVDPEEAIIKLYVCGGKSESARREYAEYLKTKLKEIPDVSSVVKRGSRDEEFLVELNPEKLRTAELSISEVIERIAKRNVNLPGGKIPQNAYELMLRTVGKFYTAEEIENVIVRSNTDGNAVRIKDIGAVLKDFKPDSAYSKLKGKDVILLEVNMKMKGDAIDVADGVKKLIGDENERIEGAFEIGFIDDFSYYVKRRLNVVVNNGLMGVVLVFFCLLFFLNLRIAFFTAFGIPFAFLSAMFLMLINGVSINLMTMFGLIIVLGMIVDDAIIVGENIFRHLEEGLPREQAALKGVLEVSKPVISTILTTISAFFPLYFAPDFYGEIFAWLVIVVTATLLASLFECLIILPSHAAEFATPLKSKKTSGQRAMRHIIKIYEKFLRKCLRFRYLFLFCVILIFFGFIWIAKKEMRVDLFPADLIDIFSVEISAQPGSSLETTYSIAARIEKEISKLPNKELDTFVTHVGYHIGTDKATLNRGTHLAQIFVYLTPQNKRARKTVNIVEEFRELNLKPPYLDQIEWNMMKPGPPTGREFEVKIIGKDYAKLNSISKKMKEYMQQRPALKDIGDDFREGKREMHVLIDEPETARLGLNFTDVAQTVFSAFEGTEASIVRFGKEEVAVRVRLLEPWRHQTNTLNTLQIRNAAGRLITLGNIAHFEKKPGLPTINHFNGQRVITAYAGIDKKTSSSAKESELALEYFKNLQKEYPGYQLVIGGEGKETDKVKWFMVKAFGMALLLIYVILALQFNSFMQPFMLILSIPLGMMGVVIALMLHGKPISLMAMMGMVGLTGVVVNDAIVLVSFINEKRRAGMLFFEALVDAGKKRFRPIILTSLTTVSGLFPVIYGWGGYEPFIAPAAITLAYGLIFATFLTLVVVPCMYHVLWDIKKVFTKKPETHFS